MEATAKVRFIRITPRKANQILMLIRGKDVESATNILHFTPKHASRVAERVLRSAVANLHQKDEGGRVDNETLYVKTAFVDEGPSMKRMLPAPMGRAYRMVKRSNHLTVVVAQKNVKQKQVPPAKVASPKAKESTPKQA